MEQGYLEYYGIGTDYTFLTKEFFTDGRKIWSWILEPEEWSYTVILLHGFLDHSMSNGTFIKWLLKEGYRVLGADMPGHGCSEGERGRIDSFKEYHNYFQDLIKIWDIDTRYTYGVGHSTGASILIDYCRCEGAQFRGILFIAPLVKMNFQFIIDKGIDLAQTKIKDLPIRKTESCRNKAFLDFKWNDPLGVKRFSLNWVKAMVEWNRVWQDFSCHVPVLLLQGKQDRVVEWKSNIPILKRSFTKLNLIYYRRGKHHLLNEAEKLRKGIYGDIKFFMDTLK